MTAAAVLVHAHPARARAHEELAAAQEDVAAAHGDAAGVLDPGVGVDLFALEGGLEIAHLMFADHPHGGFGARLEDGRMAPRERLHPGEVGPVVDVAELVDGLCGHLEGFMVELI